MNLILINLHNARDKLIYGLESVTYAVSIAGLFKLLKKIGRLFNTQNHNIFCNVINSYLNNVLSCKTTKKEIWL
jgi:hypothetical protein